MMDIGFVGWVMKNNIKVSEFKMRVSTYPDGTQVAGFDALDFVGLKGVKRRNWKMLGLRKKQSATTKIFRYSADWDELAETGCISYWDQTTQAQIPKYALSNEAEYKKITDKQQKANDVLHYSIDAMAHIESLQRPEKKDTGIGAMVIPAMLIGGIIIASVLNMYAVGQYAPAVGAIVQGAHGFLNATKMLDKIAGIQ